ncbi:hypothetical protein K461DRAFT_262451 [Myriangium duriaei CBS 260.36]|uniref:Uncharacterized protein n=1 Tax=Myriangium duriaei CBS 260.36 TaxID=1168546 RepID=A0A9P4MCZ4_9PEZI|nr:hypothetical protein K461DRAFT_262451 [Myriangium duriaei CBS 260.36]
MSATLHDEAAPQAEQGEFSSKVPRSEPLTTHGHQPGRIVNEDDGRPEFHAQTLPAGSAPKDRTFEPNSTADIPASGASASETLGGATSGEVHTGLGHPGSGQTSTEQRHTGGGRTGLEGLSGAKNDKHIEARTTDEGAGSRPGQGV